MRGLLERLRFWIASLTLGVLLVGCGTPATIARKAITGIDVANSAAARLTRPAIKMCIDKAVLVAKNGDVPKGEAALQKCAETRDKIVKALQVAVDATDLAANAVDVGEAVQQKDYDAALGPAWLAARALFKLLADTGVKLPNVPLIWP